MSDHLNDLKPPGTQNNPIIKKGGPSCHVIGLIASIDGIHERVQPVVSRCLFSCWWVGHDTSGHFVGARQWI